MCRRLASLINMACIFRLHSYWCWSNALYTNMVSGKENVEVLFPLSSLWCSTPDSNMKMTMLLPSSRRHHSYFFIRAKGTDFHVASVSAKETSCESSWSLLVSCKSFVSSIHAMPCRRCLNHNLHVHSRIESKKESTKSVVGSGVVEVNKVVKHRR